MANYLLLRNNKESGPYSLDGLMELGLKPYDLIWVQGKSAAWRYPSEVDELKGIAPVIEEQPFDRFFKKSEEKIEVAPAVSEAAPQIVQQAAIKPEHEKYIPKKSVYVTMPGQRSSLPKEPVRDPVKQPAFEPAKPVAKETSAIAAAQPTIVVTENPVAAQIKYSQPLDEIKEMYVKTLQERKTKIARKSFWMQSLKKTAVLFSFVAAGMIVGFVIKSNGSRQKGAVQQPQITQPTAIKPEVVATEPEVIKQDKLIAESEHVQPLRQPTGGYVNKNPAQEKKLVVPIVKDQRAEVIKKKKEIVRPQEEFGTRNVFAAESSDINPSTGERSRKVRGKSSEPVFENRTSIFENKPERKPAFTNNLSRLVTVKSNNYKRVAFGGIRDLELTVMNDSKFVLDRVTVELLYIRPNELPYKNSTIVFKDISPNGASTIRVPDTNRGIKVVYQISSISSRQMEEGVVTN